MMFTQRHYKAIAQTFRQISSDPTKMEVIAAFDLLFRLDNQKYESELFIEACRGKNKKVMWVADEVMCCDQEEWDEARKKIKRSKKP